MTNEVSQKLSVEERIRELHKLAKQYHWDGKQDLAIEYYKKILMLDPYNKEVVDNLTWLYEELGQFDQVIDCYNQFLSLDSDKNNLRFLRSFAGFAHQHDLFDLAVECYQRILNSGLNESDIVDDAVNLGVVYCQQGNFDLAIKYFQGILSSEWGQYSDAAFQLGMTYCEQGNFDLAINCFQQILKRKPNDSDTLYELGIVYHKQGKLDLAIECFENLLNQVQEVKHFDRSALWYELGVIYREKGQLEKAIDYFQTLIKKYPDERDIWPELSITYQTLNNHKTAELIRVGTLLSANTLTTGLAHEIKNPLAGIQLTVSNLLSDLDDGTFDVNTLRADLLKIQSNANRINERISHARRLSEDTLDPTKPPSTDMIEIKSLFQRTLEGFQQLLSIENITVNLHVPDNLPLLEANAIALEQVLANLISNSIDALRGQKKRVIHLTAKLADSEMVLTCHDTGAGIAPEDQRRIFEPLFTTKSRGQGTGIGLWLCKTIIEHWHGKIRFVSTPSEGTTFTITLPLKQQES